MLLVEELPGPIEKALNWSDGHKINNGRYGANMKIVSHGFYLHRHVDLMLPEPTGCEGQYHRPYWCAARAGGWQG
jgi:hypothetical protein